MPRPHQQPGGAGGKPPGGKQRGPWYTSPIPYVILVVIAIAVVAVLLVTQGSKAAYPELVVDSQPTLLDFYTDT